MMVYGDARLGVYATRNIEAEEELTLNYNYSEIDQKKYSGESSK